MRINILKESTPSNSKILVSSRTVNFYEVQRNGTLSLKPWPGLKEKGDTALGTSDARGGLLFSDGTSEWDRYFVYVKGSTVAYYNTLTDAAVAFTPTLTTQSNKTPIAVAGNHVMLVDGAKGYYFDRTATLSALTEIVDADFPAAARYCTALYGYFIVDVPTEEGRFTISALENAGTWAALDFATAQKIEDDLKWIDNDGSFLWLFGSYSIEVWQHTGNADFPFEPLRSVNRTIGVQAPYSVAKIPEINSFVFLSRTATSGARIFMTQDFALKPLSTPDLEQEINSYSNIKSARAQIFFWDGIPFYVISFPEANRTWFYNFATGSWAELESLVGGKKQQYPGQVFLYANQKPYVISNSSNKVTILDKDTFTNVSDDIVRIRETALLETGDGKSIRYNSLELEFEPGIGTNTELEPEVSLEWSDDYGNTWSNRHYKKLGAIGKYNNRVIYRNLGRAVSRKFRITVSDKVFCVLKAIMLEADTNGRGLTIDG